MPSLLSPVFARNLARSILRRRAAQRSFFTAALEPLTFGRQALITVGVTSIVIGTTLYFNPNSPIHLESSTNVTSDGGSKRMRRSDLIPMEEVEKHNTEDDLWIVLNGEVWDLTEFAAEGHPGGNTPLARAAGRDASNVFNPLHPPGTIETALSNASLPETALVGRINPATVKKIERPEQGEVIPVKADKAEEKIDLGMVIGLPDFTAAAKQILPAKAFAYYSAGGTDEYTLGLNRSSYNQILFRPRILVDVKEVDTSTKFMGHDVSLPMFICPCGMAKLSSPEGEAAFATAAGKCNIAQFVSTNASAPLAEIIAGAVSKEQPFFMQLYVDRNRQKTEALMQKIEASGQIKGYFVTVDAAAPGKREADERSRAEVEAQSGMSGGRIQSDNKGGGIGRSVGGFIDPSLNWEDIKWLRSRTSLPIGIKGVQTVEDAKKAYDVGLDAIYLSNHGGRALDGAPPPIYTLMELNNFYPEIIKDKKCEIYIDGGIRRGTDVIKALCLGANGVGVGRPFMYSLVYGQPGVIHAIEIMRDEIETTLRLLGVTKLSQLGPHLLNTRALDPLIAQKPSFGPDEQKR
ncbi:mitochondrial cytochrome b2- [Phaffia rhodozyma]|uniref:L-lactate dehydrogenase (cytochrome) n=1 Tax=Phaffia rhodozyma TaxID=264483 RepID=A0A0F7SR04_PHARH|nr:mitochondrial cytochrome b2- [Phaffia rhodozyma]